MVTENGFKNRKKLNLKVKQEFQRWLLIQVLITVCISAVIAAIILYFYARQEIVSSFFEAHVKLRRVSDLLLPVIAAGSMVSLVAGGFLALFLPQKIAGPLFRIERGLKSVKGGDLTTKIQLRNEDTLQDFAGNVSETVDAMRGYVEEIKESCRMLEKAVEAGDQEQVRDRLEDHRLALNKVVT